MDSVFLFDTININSINSTIQLVNIKSINKELFIQGIRNLLDDKVESFLGFSGTPEHIAENLLVKVQGSNSSYLYYAILKNGIMIGVFYIYDIKEKYNRANISLGLSKTSRGKTLTPTLIMEVLGYLFDIGFNRLGFEIEDNNLESLLLIRNLNVIGIKHEGVLRDNYGLGVNSNVFSLLKADYFNIVSKLSEQEG